MAQGYLSSKPDISWWTEQLQAGIKYRKQYACEPLWGTWNAYYRGAWKAGTLPVNMFFSMLRSVVPRTYFRNPAVSVSPDMPGFLAMAFAQVLNRIDNKVINEIGVKREMKRMVQEAWFKGTSFGKLGFGAQFSPQGDVEAPLGGRRREATEYSFDVLQNFPWFKRTPTGTVVLPDGVQHFEDARWWMHCLRRPKEDVIADPRIKTKRRAEGLPTSGFEGKFTDSRVADKTEMVDLVEAHDKKFNNVFVFSPYVKSDEGILISPTADELSSRRPNIFPLIFNPDDEHFWGVPDAAILEPSQLELNETNTLIMKHRRLSIVKLLYKKGAITPEQAATLLSEDVGAGVSVDGELADVSMQQVGDIPQGLINAKTLTIQDIRDQMGFSRNQLGDFQSRRGDTSATEAAIVQQGSEIRVDERRDAVADLLESMVIEMNEIIFSRWTQKDVFQLVGPGGVPVWVEARPSQLGLGRYSVKVDPDSGVHKTREHREQKAAEVYQILKANPLIDPMKLTKYLLTELEGVQMDDLMRTLPPVQGFEGRTLNPAGLGDLLQAGFQGLQTAGPQLPPGFEGL